MGTRIFLIRHGQTDFSKNRLYCGKSDIALNRLGQKQAKCLVRVFKGKKLSIVYTSDLRRTKETAAIVFSNRKVCLKEDMRLREIDFGLWEGLSSQQVTKSYKHRYAQWLNSPQDISTPKGECLCSLKKRVSAFLNEIIPKHKDTDIALVSHAGPIKIIIFEVLGLGLKSFWRMHQEPAAISLVEFYDTYKVLKYFNNTSHLRKAH